MKEPTRSLPLFVSALFLAILALALPDTATARDGCSSGPCTYQGWTGSYPGHCGPFDDHCHCFDNEDPETYHQEQSACAAVEPEE